jgi:hypothetical protein
VHVFLCRYKCVFTFKNMLNVIRGVGGGFGGVRYGARDVRLNIFEGFVV